MSQERILIVEGNLKMSAVLKARLEAMDYLVDRVSTVGKAMEILKTKWIDLIVMAVVLKGGTSGLQFLKEIKEKRAFAGIPVIVQSGKAAMKKTFETVGADAFFIKPYFVDLLLEEIRDILTKKILVLGDHDRVTKEIIKNLSGYDLEIDTVKGIDKFCARIILYRYSLIVLPYKIRNTIAEKLISVLRGSGKNRQVPIVVYLTTKKSSMGSKDTRKAQAFKEWCGKIGACEFMDKSFSNKQFLSLTEKSLKSF